MVQLTINGIKVNAEEGMTILDAEGKVPVNFIGRMGGMILSPEDILLKIE
ncbi:MAG: hypothetical protein M5U17_04295 [Ignavibacterium sp.]|nr:hypothetical protein [Ignavibacterium sp.]